MHNLAPPRLRRAIALLGLLNKRVKSKCHPLVLKTLPLCTEADLAGRIRYHDSMLQDHASKVRRALQMYERSLHEYVHVYNVLPQSVIDCECIHVFQSKLIQIARMRASTGDATWRNCFQCQAHTVEILYR